MNRRILVVEVILMSMVAGGMPAFASEDQRAWRMVPVGRTEFAVWRGDDHVFSLDLAIIAPDRAYGAMDATPTVKDGTRTYRQKITFTRSRWDRQVVAGPVDFSYEASQSGPQSVRLRVGCGSDKDGQVNALHIAAPSLDLSYCLRGGGGAVVLDDGTENQFAIPPAPGSLGDRVRSIQLRTRDGERVLLELGTPVPVAAQNEDLIVRALPRPLKAGKPFEFDLTLRFPKAVTFRPDNAMVDTSGWFGYEGKQDFQPGSAIGAEQWLHRPAGKHGFPKIQGATVVFEDGTPAKFWGTNISWADMALPEEDARRYADKFAKYGVNLVRMHKFVHQHTGMDGWAVDAASVWDGIMDPNDPYAFHEGAMRRFDNMHAELKQRGIYTGWSPIAFMAFHEGYRDRLVAYDELKAIRKAYPFWVHGGNTLYPFSTFAPDVQDLHIELIVKLLNHVNPLTGLRYADDPALTYVEFRNEESIFFFAVDKMAAHSPTYKRLLSEKFCQWLKRQYTSEESLRAAWKDGALAQGESLKDGTIFPFPGWGRVNDNPQSRRLLDSYRFLFEYQDEYHQRFVQAVRKTGYRGMLVGSCWNAADWLGHLYNLRSDSLVGFIDRHRYSGVDRPLVAQPGYGTLDNKWRLLTDRPFALSEWAGAHVYAAEVSPAVGYIGLGVQGWSSATQYGSNWWGIRTHNHSGIHSSSEAFYHIGQWPFISRILQSGALRTGEVVAKARISMRDLHPVDLKDSENFKLLGGANWDELNRSVPREAQAIGRVEVEFVDTPVARKLDIRDLSQWWDQDKRVLRASNGQVVWDYAGRGFFTVNTSAGVAVIGFGGGGRHHELGPVRISYDVPFANIHVVPRDPGETLQNARALLVMVLARTADRGDQLEDDAVKLFQPAPQKGHGGGRKGLEKHLAEHPTMIFEPVQLNLALRRDAPCRVYALDHDGRLPAGAGALPVERAADGIRFVLDGKRLRTMYYLVEFQDR